MAISINIAELRQLLDTTPASHNVMLVGKHGIGKSEILTSFFSAKGMRVVPLFLGQMSDPGDLIGLPRLNPDTGKTEFMPPYWFPTDGKPIVLFLDELNRARPEVLQTIMDLALNRKLAGRSLPEESRIISAVNDGEEYQLTDLDPALVSRFNIYTFRPTAEEWLLWAVKASVDERVADFINANKSLLDGDDTQQDNCLEKTPDRRGWKRVSDLIRGVSRLETFHKKILAGIVGVKAASMFFNFTIASDMLTGKEALLHFSKHRERISQMPLHELSVLNESMFRYIETDGVNSAKDKAKIAKSLEGYIDLLSSLEKTEGIAHWISLYSGGSYPQSALFILTDAPALYGKMQNFISNL